MPRLSLHLPPRTWLFCFLTVCAVLAARFPIPFVYGVELYGINAAVWLLHRKHSSTAAFYVSLVSAAAGIFLWRQTPLLALLPLEVWAVTWLSSRWKRSLFAADFVYWITVGWTLNAAGYLWLNGSDAPYVLLFVIFQLGGGLLNLLLGEMAADYGPASGSRSGDRPKLKIERISTQLCMILLLIPLASSLFLSGRYMYREALSTTQERMHDIYLHINAGVNDLSATDLRDLLVQSALRKAAINTTFDSLTLDSDITMVLLDKSGRVVESNDPSVTASNIPYDWKAGGSITRLAESQYIWQPASIKPWQTILRWSKSEFVGVYTLERVPYTLLVKQPVGTFQKNVFGLYTNSLLLMLPLLLAVAFGAIWAVRRFSKSLGELARLSTGLPGKIRTRSPLVWKDSPIREVSMLYTNFDEMSRDLAGMFREINDSQEKLRVLVHYDPLTGLANRNSFSHYLPSLLQEAREKGERVGCLFIDLDRFKGINDTYGHEAGDAVLKAIGTRLKGFNGENVKAFRLAGDEFVMILSEPLPPDLESWAEAVHTILVSEPVVFQDLPLPLSFSGGIAVYPRDGQDAESLLRSADKAMYEAKVTGRNHTKLTKGVSAS